MVRTFFFRAVLRKFSEITNNKPILFLVSTIFFTIMNISFFKLRFDLFLIIAREVNQIRNNVACEVKLTFTFKFLTSPSNFAPASSKEFLDIQATIECGFTLKRVRDMTKTYSQCSLCCSSSYFRVLLCTHGGPLQCFSTYFGKLKEIEVLQPIFPDCVISCNYVLGKSFKKKRKQWQGNQNKTIKQDKEIKAFNWLGERVLAVLRSFILATGKKEKEVVLLTLKIEVRRYGYHHYLCNSFSNYRIANKTYSKQKVWNIFD